MEKIKKEYPCALLLTMDLLGGKWKMRILWHVLHGDNRFSLLQKAIPDITHKMLITQLKELEKSGILLRHDFQTLPLRVEYSLSEQYRMLIPIVNSFCDFAKDYAQQNNIHLLD